MSAIDVSSKLGEYMLKGWVLTDEVCLNENCPVPLMRSPKGHSPVTMFCANCNGDPQNGQASGSIVAKPRSVLRQPSPSTLSSDTRLSRSSTPLTEISSGLASPTFALPVETAESTRRRQQSVAASAEIGARLLKGWAMLADECPNERCFGVPLVRPPLACGKDPRKECVACGTVYVSEKDTASWDRLVVAEQQALSSSTALAGPSSNAVSTPFPTSIPESGKKRSPLVPPVLNTTYPQVHAESTQNVAARTVNDLTSATNSEANALEISRASLQLALQSLSQKLSSLVSHPAGIEPNAIASTAEAMSKVLRALSQSILLASIDYYLMIDFGWGVMKQLEALYEFGIINRIH